MTGRVEGALRILAGAVAYDGSGVLLIAFSGTAVTRFNIAACAAGFRGILRVRGEPGIS
jgi:hypothetical protein